ncbi:MAG: hypothetical protein VYA69_01265 [Gemmatimonadota bacterium]|nr:hypothetical protein [Gemmatimonadota bacterium]
MIALLLTIPARSRVSLPVGGFHSASIDVFGPSRDRFTTDQTGHKREGK